MFVTKGKNKNKGKLEDLFGAFVTELLIIKVIFVKKIVLPKKMSNSANKYKFHRSARFRGKNANFSACFVNHRTGW